MCVRVCACMHVCVCVCVHVCVYIRMYNNSFWPEDPVFLIACYTREESVYHSLAQKCLIFDYVCLILCINSNRADLPINCWYCRKKAMITCVKIGENVFGNLFSYKRRKRCNFECCFVETEETNFWSRLRVLHSDLDFSTIVKHYLFLTLILK